MGRFLVRITIVIVAIYFIIAYYVAQFFGVDILRNSYTLLFELCVVAYVFSEGKYHCRYIKWTMLSIFFCDLISHTDYYFNYIPLNYWSLLPLGILGIGITTSCTLAIRHFIQVLKLKRKIHAHNARNTR